MKKFIGPVIDIKKYGGKQVAIIGRRIVASGYATTEVLAKARRKLPRRKWNEILLVVVPKGLNVVYRI